MRDEWGRTIEYMRISITDRCNLRCKYCMPDGVEAVPRWDIRSLEEILAAAYCAAGLGVRFLKVTGGEQKFCQILQDLKFHNLSSKILSKKFNLKVIILKNPFCTNYSEDILL